MIPFNRPCYTGNEDAHVARAMRCGKLSGDGPYSSACQNWFEQRLGSIKTLLTPSCTHALEMAAFLVDIRPGDEVIMPSYTFVSTANAFVVRGARVVFVDIRDDNMNIDERKIKSAITPNTRAIVVVHYAGVACEMDEIMGIARNHNLYVIEDAAQAMMSTYKGRPLGTIGHLGAYSFHETKNYTSGGEGGLLLINDERFVERAEIIREKGTNRKQFFRGMVDKYTWVDIGSSYLPCELQAAYLYGQLEKADEINARRLAIYNSYVKGLASIEAENLVKLPKCSVFSQSNGHMFYLRARDMSERSRIIDFLRASGVQAVFHYIPLHTAPCGQKFGRFQGADEVTTAASESLLRLPISYQMNDTEIETVIRATLDAVRGH